MPLTQDSVLQKNKGSFNAASGSVSLPGNTTADSTVVITASAGNNNDPEVLLPPTGFTQAGSVVGGISQYHCYPFVFYKKTAGGESSWTLPFDTGGSGMVAWQVFEVEGLDFEAPVSVYSQVNPTSDDPNPILTNNSTGNSQSSPSYDVLALALFPTFRGGTTAVGIDGHTNGFVEQDQVDLNDGTNTHSLSVALKTSQVLQPYECSASFDAGVWSSALVVAFTGQGAKWAPDITAFTGFGFGTTSGWTTTSPVSGCQGMAIFDTVVGSPAISSLTPKSGVSCLECSATAAAESVAWNNPGGLLVPNSGTEQTYPVAVVRAHVRFPSSRPSADTELLAIEAGSLANGMEVWYRSASQKLAVKIGSGTEVLSDATVDADKWIGIDIRYDPRTTTHKADWQVDYDVSNATLPVEQGQASTSSMTVDNITKLRLGWSVARTATVRYADVAISATRQNYPIGNFDTHLLKVDPNGTPTTNNDSDWRVFTSNGGTLTAWSASGARDALDDVPPVVGASADGITQITVNGTGFATIPFETYTAAPTEVLRAAKIYAAGWAASTNAADIEATIDDGSNTTQFFPRGDHNFDNSTLVWIARTVKIGSQGYYILTQAKLDGFKVVVGGSQDANPDIGFHAFFLEVITQPATVANVVTVEDVFTCDQWYDPLDQGVMGYKVTVPAGTRGATLSWTIGGVDDSHHVDPDVNNPVTWEKVIGAEDITEVTFVGFTADP